MIEKKLLQLFPRLEILPLEKLLVYELYDPVRIAHLTKKIAQDNVFSQPIIVGEDPISKRLIVLDGVNRIEVLKQLGVKDVVAHIVNYFDTNEVELFSNHHYFFSKQNQLIDACKSFVSGQPVEMDEKKALAGVTDQSLMGYVRFNGTILNLGAHESIEKTVQFLNSLVNTYLGQTDFCRKSEVDLSLSNVPMEIVFRRFTPQEIVSIALAGSKLNSGITRHLVSVYCLGLNVPLSLLQSEIDITEKNEQLKNMLYNVVVDRGYRYYPRPVYKFNEKE